MTLTPPDPLPPEAARLDRSARTMRTRFDGGTMPWRIWGEGPPLVLFHGGHGSWLHWLRNIEPLARHHRLVVPDLPGFGEADALPAPGPGTLTRALLDGIGQLGLPRQFHLGAFSYGCTFAGEVQARVPERVRRLFLIGSWEIGRYHRLDDRLLCWQETAPGPGRDAIHRHNLAVLMLHDPARIDETTIRMQSRNTLLTRKGISLTLEGTDLAARLRAALCPVTCLYGEQDALTLGYLDERRRLIDRLAPGSGLHLLPETGHWAQYEAADEVNALILSRIARDLA
ncbi:alpha/beta fold hydrolase [Pseudogemmobacter sonorensis]|uniref:alpha/beta fold hydrolase n=1 Tax=Pseudogemmobacter sonorensis TaxID=2989681 RepID=UPI0036B446DC